MSQADAAGPPSGSGRFARAVRMLIISSVAFTFISYWRTAAVVLCDLGSTAFYIGGIVEQSVGKAAPWFILAVMVFSYAVRSVYIESCTLFVRGGVYRVVKEAMGGFLAKLSVSALMFDYILTGPISGVSAGQYIVGLILEIVAHVAGITISDSTRTLWKAWGSVAIACAITIYFFRKNVIGIHESSEKAFKIMIITTVMAVIILGWCGLSLIVKPANQINAVPLAPDLNTKRIPPPAEREKALASALSTVGLMGSPSGQGPLLAASTLVAGRTNEKPATFDDPTGFLGNTVLGKALKSLPAPPENPGQIREKHKAASSGVHWLSLIGVIGICLAFGHSVLAMSGEETLAQVYREVESPKLPNFKKAAFIVFVYSLVLTAGISFLAVMLIPDSERMPKYADNLIGGLAMNVWGPLWARLLLNGFVVVVGFLILAGAVNTAIIGSNGVLNRVAEDGVMPDWFLKPHPKYGTTYRVLYLILFLQLFTIIASRGNVLLLGEAYAFGVVWSFVFKAMAMVVLRFKDRRPRQFMVPLNVKVRSVEVPLGLMLIFVILLVAAIMNLLTKELATTWGLGFTTAFLTVFMITEHYHERKRRGTKHEHLEQFNQAVTEETTPEALGLAQPYRKLVAIRSPQNLFMLEKALAETDPETTAVVVMTAKPRPPGDGAVGSADVTLDTYDQQLMTAVVDVAEKAGKEVKPLIVPTNNPLHAVLRMAKDLKVQELIMGASNKYNADEQLEQVALYWMNIHGNQEAPPLTVRLLSRQRDVYLDLNGGNRIPKISERQAKSVAELRAAGVGIDRVLLAHDGSVASSDLLQAVMTLLDPDVRLGLVRVPLRESAPAREPGAAGQESQPANGDTTPQDLRRARKLGRELEVYTPPGEWAAAVVRVAQENGYNLIVLALPSERPDAALHPWDAGSEYILRHAHCRVFLAAAPVIPDQPDETPPTA